LWFGLPIPEENKKRFDSSQLQCWTDEARAQLKPKMVHELAQQFAAPTKAVDSKQLLNLLGIDTANVKCGIQGGTETRIEGGHLLAREVLHPEGNPSIALPIIKIIPAGAKGNVPMVVGLAQDGKAGFLKNRAATIAELLNRNVAVCLPDLRGTGETANDGRGRQSGATSNSASLLMHGQTVPGIQLQELVMLLEELQKHQFGPIALWGDSFVEPNDPKVTLAVPYDNNVKLPRQAEPMGTLLALLGGMHAGKNVKAVYARGGLVSFQSILDSPFCYFPHDAVVPGLLANIDLSSVANANQNVRLEALVDGLNRRVDQQTLEKTYGKFATVRAEPSSQAEVAAWLVAQLKK